jgi:hypothetical protein
MWRGIPRHCPTPEALVADHAIDFASEVRDQWGNPFKIICEEDDDVTIMSAGADKKEGTADDIRVPEVGEAR